MNNDIPNKLSKNELEANSNSNSSEDIAKSKDKDYKEKRHISIQIISKTSNDAKEEFYTIDSDKPLTRKEITQIVIEKTGNNHNISEIKVKYSNSNEGDLLIKFDNMKNSRSLDSNEQSTISVSDNNVINKIHSHQNKSDRYDDNDNNTNAYTSRSFKTSQELKSEKSKAETSKDKQDKSYFEQSKFIKKENGASKEKGKKNKKSKLKFLDENSTSPQKSSRYKLKTQNSNVTGIANGGNSNGNDERSRSRAQRHDNFGNIIARNSNHKICFADSLRKKLCEVVEIQSHKDYIANMNKQDYTKKETVKCKCCSCIVF